MLFLTSCKNVAGKIVFGIDPTPVDVDRDTYSDEQNSLGAPVEKVSPLGYTALTFTVVYLIIQGVIGTGIFVTPATILTLLGSVGSSYVFWVMGFVITLMQISVYIEYVTYFPRRNGGDVVYLEQAYPRPRLMVSAVYAAVEVVLSFATSSASAFATYTFKAAGFTQTAWQQRGLALAPLFLCFAIVAVNNKFASRLTSFLGFVKMVFVAFMIISGLVVLSGHSRVGNQNAVFSNAWANTTTEGHSISSAILKVVFSYSGSGYAFNVVAETAPQKTIRAYKLYVPLTMLVIFFIYILIVTLLYAGIGSVAEIQAAGSLVSSVYFTNVFGESALRVLNAFVAISAFGHLLGVFLAHLRSLRECGRQGILPYPEVWTSVRPFGTPVFPVFITLVVNIVVLLAPPPGDAYNFVLDLGSYSSYIFNMLLFVGLLRVRLQRKKQGLSYKEFKLWTPVLYIAILWTLFVLAMSFVPPEGTLIGSDVSFFYATYPLTTIGLLAACFGYYFVWSYVLPKMGKYEHRIELFELSSGEKGHTVIKVPYDQLQAYDAENGESLTREGEASLDDAGEALLDDTDSAKKDEPRLTEKTITKA